MGKLGKGNKHVIKLLISDSQWERPSGASIRTGKDREDYRNLPIWEAA